MSLKIQKQDMYGRKRSFNSRGVWLYKVLGSITDCCPSIILIIAGPWIYVLGAVYPEKPVIELLTDFILMMNHPEDNGKRVEELAVFFESLHLAFRTLDNYYKGLKGLDEAKAEKIQRFFPYRN
ncbi:unnamed protein product [Rhizophagus irregularis]|nr:unnamed protein product [Rhizophagus irregularis]CAB5303429.1 unnamed protein product [Rhizophagus irregularis]